MASKKTEIDPIKSQYKLLKEVNQRLKTISDVYYISFNNFIYMHSNVDFIEKVAVLKDDINLSSYQGIMYLPNELFNFTRDAKITKMIYTDLQSSLLLGQDNNDDISIKLNRIYIPNDEVREEDNIKLNIIPKMYNKFHNYFNYINNLEFIYLTEEDIHDIIKNNIVGITNIRCRLSISKNLVYSLKKEDKLSYSILSSAIEDDNKVYVIYKEENEEMNIYTLCAYLNI